MAVLKIRLHYFLYFPPWQVFKEKTRLVRILAITNHNHFDVVQYAAFETVAAGHCQIWPGIEIDILEDGKRAHLIVIANPKKRLRLTRK